MVGRDTHPKESVMKHELPYEIENKCLLTLEEARAQLAHVEKKLAVAKTPENEVERDMLKSRIAQLEAALAAH